ncbi:hypothetical protein F442_19488, partial [Phytophthora nicotianae P10297]
LKRSLKCLKRPHQNPRIRDKPQTAQNLHHQWDDHKIDTCDRTTLGIGGQNQQIRRNLHTEP